MSPLPAPSRPGFVAGLLAWVVGALVALVVVVSSPASRATGPGAGPGSTPLEATGWVVLDAHLVRLVRDDSGVTGALAIGHEVGVTSVLYAVPVLALLGAALAVVHLRRARSLHDGWRCGLAVVPGYLLGATLTLGLVHLGADGPVAIADPLAAIVTAGVIYPYLVAGAGGMAAGTLAWRVDGLGPISSTETREGPDGHSE